VLLLAVVFTLGLFVSLPNPVHSMSSSALGSEIPCADEMNAYLQCLGEEFNNCFQNEAGPDPEDEFAPCGNLESGDFCHNLFMCSAITVTEDCWIEAKYLEECAETDGQSCARMVCTPTSMGGILSLQ
jgi:hypothetical protein